MASSSESHGTHDLNAATNPMTLSKDELNVVEIEGLIDAYWGMAFMEGRQGRSVDTPEGSAQETRSAISRRLSEAAIVIQTLQRSVHELEDRVSALEEERQNLIATKREQITRLTSLAEAAEQQVRDMSGQVEQAFRDGLSYGGNVENADPDIAWQHSRARLLLREGGEC